MQKWLDQDKFLSALPWPSAGPYASEALQMPKGGATDRLSWERWSKARTVPRKGN